MEVGELELGAHCRAGKASFRAWAPHARNVAVVVEFPETATYALQAEGNGYFNSHDDAGLAALQAGTLYKYSVDGKGPYPDPCSRFQPAGPHGPSLLVDPGAYQWHDGNWRGVQLHGQVIYELHVGAFTAAGTFDAARETLAHLSDLGVTMVELLPIAECPGHWNWGYDGVQLFAPYHVYGDHEALKRFVDAAHQQGIAVMLDVVYNHLGPDGNYLKCFSADYFSTQYSTEWGEALNFDGPNCRGARDFVIGNARYWMREFHLDGLRLDATQSLFDSSKPHIVAELVAGARRAAGGRSIIITAENEPERGEHMDSVAEGGFNLDAMWNDDFHHAARVALTGSRDGYFYDYTGRAQEFVSAIRRGFLYQGQYYHWQKQARGSPLQRSKAASCVHYLQNHDQVGNSRIGDRLHNLAAPARYRALTAVLLLGPQTPLLFMGQEFLASSPFMFFADHRGELQRLAHAGRRQFLAQFRAYADEAVQQAIPDPAAAATFLNSKLDWKEAALHASALAMHRDLLRLRRQDPVISQQDSAAIDGATLSERAFVLRWADARHGDRLLVVNLDYELVLEPAPEPLLAPSRNCAWGVLWSSEDFRYDGQGIVSPVTADQRWRISANSAVLLQATVQSAVVMSTAAEPAPLVDAPWVEAP
jgi:maltooligosyltrehalose trehalohydrolase